MLDFELAERTRYKLQLMSDYMPISRRPIAAGFQRTAERTTRFCVRHGIHPDAISYLSILAALAAVLTAYVGLFGQALGVRREFGGVMSKPWRMVALHIGAWLTFFLSGQPFASLTVLDWTCLVVIAGCVQTIVVRLKRITAALQNKG